MPQAKIIFVITVLLNEVRSLDKSTAKDVTPISTVYL